MGNKNFKSIGKLLLMFPFLAFVSAACSDDDSETIYEAYGLVEKNEGNNYKIIMDNGYVLYPQKSVIDPSRLKDSMRLFTHFIIEKEQDSSALVHFTFAQEILTKDIIPYDEAILDSIGNDPIKITKYWMAHGYLNLEFLYNARYNLTDAHRHMINLLQHPTIDGKIKLEFLHNDFGDYCDKTYRSVASFPLNKILTDTVRPIHIEIIYHPNENTVQTIEFKY